MAVQPCLASRPARNRRVDADGQVVFRQAFATPVAANHNEITLGANARRPMRLRYALANRTQFVCTTLDNSGVYASPQSLGGGTWSDGIGEHVQIRERQRLEERKRLVVVVFGFAWETSNDVRPEREDASSSHNAFDRSAIR
jgi:hypothetical protein